MAEIIAGARAKAAMPYLANISRVVICSGKLYIYIIYTPNLGLRNTVLVQEREHGRFRGSTKNVGESIEGAGGAQRKEPVLAPRSVAWLSLLLPRLRVSNVLYNQERFLFSS